ncbi:MAG TPA: MerR family transcriptional regulator [Gemmatimonadales bacterium]
MASDDAVYELTELSDLAGVTPRTVRYYIQQGLLRSPGTPGPGAKYDTAHLDRLRLIRRLQREHLPLAEIRRRLESLTDAEVRRLVEAPEPARSSAAEYVRQVLREPSRPSFLAAQTAPPGPAAAPDRSQWERIALGPDLELHVRRPLSRAQNKMVDKLLDYARRLLEDDTP